MPRPSTLTPATRSRRRPPTRKRSPRARDRRPCWSRSASEPAARGSRRRRRPHRGSTTISSWRSRPRNRKRRAAVARRFADSAGGRPGHAHARQPRLGRAGRGNPHAGAAAHRPLHRHRIARAARRAAVADRRSRQRRAGRDDQPQSGELSAATSPRRSSARSRAGAAARAMHARAIVRLAIDDLPRCYAARSAGTLQARASRARLLA